MESGAAMEVIQTIGSLIDEFDFDFGKTCKASFEDLFVPRPPIIQLLCARRARVQAYFEVMFTPSVGDLNVGLHTTRACCRPRTMTFSGL